MYHSPVLSAHTSFYSQVKAFMSAWAAAILNSCGMFSIAMQWISHCVQGQIDSVGVFVLVSGSVCGCVLFLLFASLSPAGETQVWLGDLRVVAFGWLWLLFLLLQSICRFQGLSVLAFAFHAYSHVRTEPQRDIGHTRGKKIFS